MIEIGLREAIEKKLRAAGLWEGPHVMDSLVRDHRTVARMLDDEEGRVSADWPYRAAIIGRQIISARAIMEAASIPKPPAPSLRDF